MFTIYGGKTDFDQWDKEQRVTDSSLTAGDKVIFLESSGMTVPMKAYIHNGDVVVDVPNKLLATEAPILVRIAGRTETYTKFPVNAKDKPKDYVFEDNSIWKPEADEVTLAAAKEYTDNRINAELRGIENGTY